MPSLFNRPAWAKSTNTANNGEAEVNIFSHSSSFQDIVADGERRRKEKLERKKAKEERRSSVKHERVEEEDRDKVAKKRRITLEDGEALLDSVGLPANVSSDVVDDDEDSEDEAKRPARRSPRKSKRRSGEALEPGLKASRRAPEVVQIGDDGDEDDSVIQHVRTVEPDEEPESDEEIAELRRKARVQRQQREQNKQRPRAANGSGEQRGEGGNGDTQDTSDFRPLIPEDEPVVQLFIDSRIPNTNQLIVQRKLSQRLEEVRKAWCNKQGFPEEFWPNVFFIHRTRRLYDVTTCKSLGLEVDAFGGLTMKGAKGKEGVEKVYLQAVTQEIFREILAERDREAKRRSGELATEEQSAASAEDEEAKEESLMRVTMVAKNRPELKLKVKPNTLFSKIATAYRKNQKLDEKQSIRLEFDGEPLAPDDQVQNTEVSDMDIIHVHLT